jgi:hypothetical protein
VWGKPKKKKPYWRLVLAIVKESATCFTVNWIGRKSIPENCELGNIFIDRVCVCVAYLFPQFHFYLEQRFLCFLQVVAVELFNNKKK